MPSPRKYTGDYLKPSKDPMDLSDRICSLFISNNQSANIQDSSNGTNKSKADSSSKNKKTYRFTSTPVFSNPIRPNSYRILESSTLLDNSTLSTSSIPKASVSNNISLASTSRGFTASNLSLENCATQSKLQTDKEATFSKAQEMPHASTIDLPIKGSTSYMDLVHQQRCQITDNNSSSTAESLSEQQKEEIKRAVTQYPNPLIGLNSKTQRRLDATYLARRNGKIKCTINDRHIRISRSTERRKFNKQKNVKRVKRRKKRNRQRNNRISYFHRNRINSCPVRSYHNEQLRYSSDSDSDTQDFNSFSRTRKKYNDWRLDSEIFTQSKISIISDNSIFLQSHMTKMNDIFLARLTDKHLSMKDSQRNANANFNSNNNNNNNLDSSDTWTSTHGKTDNAGKSANNMRTRVLSPHIPTSVFCKYDKKNKNISSQDRMFSNMATMSQSRLDRVTGENEVQEDDADHTNSSSNNHNVSTTQGKYNVRFNESSMTKQSNSYTMPTYSHPLQNTDQLSQSATDLLPNGCPRFPLKRTRQSSANALGAWIGPKNTNQGYQLNTNNSAWTDNPYQLSKPEQADRSYEVHNMVDPDISCSVGRLLIIPQNCVIGRYMPWLKTTGIPTFTGRSTRAEEILQGVERLKKEQKDTIEKYNVFLRQQFDRQQKEIEDRKEYERTIREYEKQKAQYEKEQEALKNAPVKIDNVSSKPSLHAAASNNSLKNLDIKNSKQDNAAQPLPLPVQESKTVLPPVEQIIPEPIKKKKSKRVKSKSQLLPKEGDAGVLPADSAASLLPVDSAVSVASVDSKANLAPGEGDSSLLLAEGDPNLPPPEGDPNAPPPEGDSSLIESDASLLLPEGDPSLATEEPLTEEPPTGEPTDESQLDSGAYPEEQA